VNSLKTIALSHQNIVRLSLSTRERCINKLVLKQVLYRRKIAGKTDMDPFSEKSHVRQPKNNQLS